MTGQIAETHAELMDRTYRLQRRFYDLTRAWYLLGRDHLLADLDPPPDGRVLELACGTGRNLDRIFRQHPGLRLYGLDISREMLASAEAKLNNRAFLARADACRFSGPQIFGAAGFDRIVLSYAVSMIPDWETAIANAVEHLAPGGSLHIVDFHDQSGLPRWFRGMLWSWLARFHVTPRTGMADSVDAIARARGCSASWTPLYRGYAQYAVIRRD